MVALCDVYDALRSPRPYKEPWSKERAQAYIREQAGLYFDPALVDVLSGMFQQIEDMQGSLADPLPQTASVAAEQDHSGSVVDALSLRRRARF